MRIVSCSRIAALAVIALTVVACASVSKPLGQWRNPAFSGKFDSMLIIGVTSRSTRRRVFEDKFVEALKADKIEAVPSYSLITSTMDLSRLSVTQAIEGQDLDAVLLTRMVGIRDRETYQRPGGEDETMNYFTYYDNALEQTSDGYYSQFRVFTLETSLYDTATGEMVWSMQSEIMDASRPRHVIEEQIKLTIRMIKSQGLI